MPHNTTEERKPYRPSKKKPVKKNSSYRYLKYSNLALQMGVLIFAGAYAGQYLDNRWELEPLFTLLLSLLGLGIAFYLVIRGLNRDDHAS